MSTFCKKYFPLYVFFTNSMQKNIFVKSSPAFFACLIITLLMFDHHLTPCQFSIITLSMFDHHLVNVWSTPCQCLFIILSIFDHDLVNVGLSSCQCLIITLSMHLLPPAPGLLEATASKSTLVSSPTWRSCLLAFSMCLLVFVKPFLFLQGYDVKTESVGDRLLKNLIICNPSF